MSSPAKSNKNLTITLLIAIVAFVFFAIMNGKDNTSHLAKNPSAINPVASKENHTSKIEHVSTNNFNQTGDSTNINNLPVTRNLPPDLEQALKSPPPPLPADLQAQLDAPPPPLPEDIRRAMQTPPRAVSIDEVNNPK